jgi:hypothetical protein
MPAKQGRVSETTPIEVKCDGGGAGDRLASKSLVGGAESDGKGIEGSIQGIDVGISGGLGGKGRCR